MSEMVSKQSPESRKRLLIDFESLFRDFSNFFWGRKKHINFFNINFLAPTQNPPFWTPRKKFMCLISWERTQKGTPHRLFWADFWVKNGVPNGPFSATKSLVYCFFPPLIFETFRTFGTPDPEGQFFRDFLASGLRDSLSRCQRRPSGVCSHLFPREASILIFKIRSCTVRTDL